MRNWNNSIVCCIPFFIATLYFTYEELKQMTKAIMGANAASLYFTYEELKPLERQLCSRGPFPLYFTYEELKL